jgi:succinate dehydrogenase / fumarate reductase flavoprotein subunit
MEVGPTTHYMMGGIKVDAETEMSTVSGIFAAGECAAGLHGANRLGGNSLSDLLVFGKRAGDHAAEFAKKQGAGRIDQSAVDQVAKEALAPFERAGSGAEGPYQIQHELQEMMQHNVGIVRTEHEMEVALKEIIRLEEQASRCGVYGNREFNAGWHTALDLPNLLTVSEAIARAAIERKESRGGHFRDDYPEKSTDYGHFNIMVKQGPGGEMQISRVPIPEMPAELKQVVEEMK